MVFFSKGIHLSNTILDFRLRKCKKGLFLKDKTLVLDQESFVYFGFFGEKINVDVDCVCILPTEELN